MQDDHTDRPDGARDVAVPGDDGAAEAGLASISSEPGSDGPAAARSQQPGVEEPRDALGGAVGVLDDGQFGCLSYPDAETKAGPEILTNALPGRVESWRRRSAMGAVLTGFALGLQQALEPQRNEPAVIVQTSGEPPHDLPVDADVEQLIPSQSVVRVRPWLLEGADAISANEEEDAGRPDRQTPSDPPGETPS